MFFQKELDHRVHVSPEYFGPGLIDEVLRRLRTEVEGTCHGKYGFIVCVLAVVSMSKGVLQDTIGYAAFDVMYKAIVLKPFKGEVMDAMVTSVTKVGWIRSFIPLQMGFFSDVGPLHIFVSSHLIPPDMKFDVNANPPCYISEDQTQKIAQDDLVRLKIVGLKSDASEIFAIGTIKEDYLGI